ncbi:hypothetical protein MKX01_012911 [Papaver californicum]|nr:hypothetical protein MKX01_012911 [Papaver californicum]
MTSKRKIQAFLVDLYLTLASQPRSWELPYRMTAVPYPIVVCCLSLSLSLGKETREKIERDSRTNHQTIIENHHHHRNIKMVLHDDGGFKVVIMLVLVVLAIILTNMGSRKGFCFDDCINSCGETAAICYSCCVGACLQGEGDYNSPAFAINFHIDNVTTSH